MDKWDQIQTEVTEQSVTLQIFKIFKIRQLLPGFKIQFKEEETLC
jgi:hypothetical protein